MLVLSRKQGEAIVVGDGPTAITVYVNRIVGNRVTLGLAAPEAIRIRRAEIPPHEQTEPESAVA